MNMDDGDEDDKSGEIWPGAFPIIKTAIGVDIEVKAGFASAAQLLIINFSDAIFQQVAANTLHLDVIPKERICTLAVKAVHWRVHNVDVGDAATGKAFRTWHYNRKARSCHSRIRRIGGSISCSWGDYWNIAHTKPFS
jgi:hypothetical protein